MQAFVASPGRPGPFAGVLIIHEIFGLNDDMREIARRFANAGYVGFAIDLFAGGNRAVCLALAFAGLLVRPLSAVERACPIVGSYPGRDYTARGARPLAECLERAGIPYDIKVYPGALHAFFSPRGNTYNAEAAEDGWTRTLSFFNQHLAPAPPASATH